MLTHKPRLATKRVRTDGLNAVPLESWCFETGVCLHKRSNVSPGHGTHLSCIILTLCALLFFARPRLQQSVETLLICQEDNASSRHELAHPDTVGCWSLHLLLQTMPVLLRPTIASPLAGHCAASEMLCADVLVHALKFVQLFFLPAESTIQV